MEYNNVAQSAQGLSYLAGDILPWEDYVIMRIDDETSISVYGNAVETSGNYVYFEEATVRTVTRATDSGYTTYYDVDESTESDVYCYVYYPYYAYGNMIGNNYSLPVSDNITACFLAAAVSICAVMSVFRVLWSLKRCVKRR